MTGKRNDSIVQKQNCVVEEVKEVEFRSPRAWEIYLLQNLPFWFKKVSQFSRCGRANKTADEENKTFVTENTESESFCMEGFREKKPLSSKIHWYKEIQQ